MSAGQEACEGPSPTPALEPPAVTLRLQIRYPRKLNWSFLQAGMPPVWSLTLHNRGPRRATNLNLRLQLPGFLDTGLWPLPALAPRARRTVKLAGLPWVLRDLEAAMRLTDTRQSHLLLEIAGRTLKLPVEVLAADEWCAGVAWDGDQFCRLEDLRFEYQRYAAVPQRQPDGLSRPRGARAART
jgi:hypothetical protein